jgi:hypothetical protein
MGVQHANDPEEVGDTRSRPKLFAALLAELAAEREADEDREDK